MNLVDLFLKQFNLKSYDEITDEEKKMLMDLDASIKNVEPSIEKLKIFFTNLKRIVEEKLVKEPEFKYFIIPNRKHIYLKARLENLIFLEQFLNLSDRMKDFVESYIKNLK